MRNKKRIPICLKLFFQNNILSHFLTEHPGKTIDNIYQNWKLIEEEWDKYPDYRFGQLLSNLNLVNRNIENIIWNIEEDDWLIENNYCKLEDIKFWGNIYDEHNHRINKINYILLKDLNISHIKGIIKWFTVNDALKQINSKYLKYFNEKIKLNE